MSMLLECITCTMSVQSCRAPGTGIAAGADEPPCRRWDLNHSPLEEQLVLFSQPSSSVLHYKYYYSLLCMYGVCCYMRGTHVAAVYV